MEAIFGQKQDLEVTQEHLTRAMKVPNGLHLNRYCLIGQAAMDVFGDEFKSCAGNHIRTSPTFDIDKLWYSKKIERLISLFDDNQFEKLASLLPTTITLTYGEPQAE